MNQGFFQNFYKILSTVLICHVMISVLGESAIAQITPDTTTSGSTNTVVTPYSNLYGLPGVLIEGGATRGANLFHSFSQFSILEQNAAYFANPVGITNILTRVTGNTASNIFGRLGVDGSANLFFLNPNGIVFGPNARLDIGGSFFATTADSFVFDNGQVFSAINPQPAPILTVNLIPGLQLGNNPGAIEVRGNGQAFWEFGTATNFTNPNLELLPGRILGLVGGNVNINAGLLQTSGGRVEIGGLAGAGTVKINADDGSLIYPASIARANVSLTNKAGINVIAGEFGGGSININANDISIIQESLLTSGMFGGLGETGARTGDITLTATGKTTIDRSRVENNVNRNINGETIANNGNITINAGSFVLTNKGQLDVSNLGRNSNTVNPGDAFAGDIRVNADGLLTIGDITSVDPQTTISSNGFNGRIFLTSKNSSVNINNSNISTTSNDSNTNSSRFSEINIAAPQGSIALNNSQLNSTNSSTGYAGNILLNARDLISLRETNILNQGRVGNIFIGASSFSASSSFVPNQITITNSTLNTSNLTNTTLAGDIVLNARDLVSITSSSPIGSNPSERAIQSLGNFGRISIGNTATPKKVELNNTSLSTTNRGITVDTGNSINAGPISIYALENIKINNSLIETTTSRVGDGGNLTIEAINGDIRGNILLQNASLIASNIENEGVGKAGNIQITTGGLSVSEGSQIQSLIRQGGEGSAGNITIEATGKVSFFGNSDKDIGGNTGLFNSGVITRVPTGGSGNAGDININAFSIFLTDKAYLSSDNDTDGFAGKITLNASEQISLAKQSVISSEGRFGRILIGTFDPDAVSPLPVPNQINIDNSFVSTTNSGDTFAGDIVLGARDQISLINQSNISSNGNFGLIFIGKNESYKGTTSPREVRLDNSTLSTTNAAVKDFTEVEIAAGDISIDAIDNISLTNGSSVNASTQRLGRGGTINLTARNISLNNGSQLRTTTYSSCSVSSNCNAGNIILKATDRITISGRNPNKQTDESARSGIFATTAEGSTGQGGDIIIDPFEVRVTDGGRISVNSEGEGKGGSITLAARRLILDNDGGITAQTSMADGGDIILDLAEILVLRRNSNVSASVARGQGNGGNITINSPFVVADPSKDNNIIANASRGKGGNILLPNAVGIYGIVPRSSDSPNTNDISASSEFNSPGTVQINNSAVDPTQGIISLPMEPNDPSKQIAQGCGETETELAITGRGGLPPRPDEPLNQNTIWEDTRLANVGNREIGMENIDKPPVKPTSKVSTPVITPATGWVFNDKGEVQLISQTPNISPDKLGSVSNSCSAR
ncbi:MAG: filamentous hemagglutinin N-terminal domain-containing protein [Scytonematopsis contorta HA4267-MV1]|jgi:filamentous hemagglutinin family protein|nr:filamentous hemagglutinin N-terminal domain-containing protein [Scytonematopsis contorta HA4267-MV1]